MNGGRYELAPAYASNNAYKGFNSTPLVAGNAVVALDMGGPIGRLGSSDRRPCLVSRFFLTNSMRGSRTTASQRHRYLLTTP